MRTPQVIASLAVAILFWACQDGPTEPARKTLPLSTETVETPPKAVKAESKEEMEKPPYHLGHGGHMMIASITQNAEELGLSENQKTKIDSIIDKAHEGAPSMKEGFKSHKKEMHELFKAETLDEEAITSKHDEMQAGIRGMKTASFSAFLDALEVLTADQRTQLVTLLDGQKGHKHEKREHSMLLHAIDLMSDDLQLSQDQREGLDAIRERVRTGMAPLKEKKMALRAEMHELMKAAELDRAAIEAKHTEILDIKDEKSSKRFAATLESLEVLTAEQRARLITTLEDCWTGKGESICEELMSHKKGKFFHK